MGGILSEIRRNFLLGDGFLFFLLLQNRKDRGEGGNAALRRRVAGR